MQTKLAAANSSIERLQHELESSRSTSNMLVTKAELAETNLALARVASAQRERSEDTPRPPTRSPAPADPLGCGGPAATAQTTEADWAHGAQDLPDGRPQGSVAMDDRVSDQLDHLRERTAALQTERDALAVEATRLRTDFARAAAQSLQSIACAEEQAKLLRSSEQSRADDQNHMARMRTALDRIRSEREDALDDLYSLREDYDRLRDRYRDLRDGQSPRDIARQGGLALNSTDDGGASAGKRSAR